MWRWSLTANIPGWAVLCRNCGLSLSLSWTCYKFQYLWVTFSFILYNNSNIGWLYFGLYENILRESRMYIPFAIARGMCILDSRSILLYNPKYSHPILFKYYKIIAGIKIELNCTSEFHRIIMCFPFLIRQIKKLHSPLLMCGNYKLLASYRFSKRPW